MHSGKEKWEYYRAVSGEVYKIIINNLDISYVEIITEIKEHLKEYNDKTNLYRFDILREQKDFDTGDFNFVMHEFISIKKQLVHEKKFNLKGIIRRIKIDKILKGE